MLKLLIGLFVKDSENVRDAGVRRAYGTLCSVYGILLNLILFAAKYFAGILSGSVAITADAFNNLSDAVSSVVTLLGFAMSGKKPDPEHPFGHGRMEYLAGLIISATIIVMGFELGKSSVEKILSPSPVQLGILPAVILILSILVKCYMFLYNRAVGRKINSTAMLATAADALSDSVSTFVVLAAMAVSSFSSFNVDAWAGLAVAVFICRTGFEAARDTLSPLLGKAPEPELVQNIERIVMAHPEVIGIHDLIVHDYGPGRLMISLHAEVDGYGDMFVLHDAIDQAENELRQDLGCLATIHMDPLETGNEDVLRHKEELVELLTREISPRLTIHDFRMVPGVTHTNLIFDAAIPSDHPESDSKLSERIRKLVHDTWDDHFAVVTVDRIFY